MPSLSPSQSKGTNAGSGGSGINSCRNSNIDARTLRGIRKRRTIDAAVAEEHKKERTASVR